MKSQGYRKIKSCRDGRGSIILLTGPCLYYYPIYVRSYNYYAAVLINFTYSCIAQYYRRIVCKILRSLYIRDGQLTGFAY